MNTMFDENINEIIDDTFMTKDVSELVKGDYCLFHVEQDGDNFKSYFWKDGVVFCGNSDGSSLITNEYTKGTLQEYVDNLGGRRSVKEVTLYTVVKDKRVVAQDHIDFYEQRYNSVPVYNLGGDTPTKESITIQKIPVEHRVFYRRGTKEEYYIAMTEDVREVFGLELKVLNDYKTLCRDQEERLNGALKTNETLVKYKNDLINEVENLTSEVCSIKLMSFWKRLKFLFTGVIP